MTTYLVGGAVRDGLLGLPVHDHDYVVVGSTVQQMLAAGFLQVGQDFPVFLHPETRAEYALARTERKSGRGYKGFVFATESVSLAEDLARRDLTINAMARDVATQALIDPFHGQSDLENRILRHVSPAFAEDPLRVLRVARFAAKFAELGFQIAPETLALMQQMVCTGELEHLVPERVFVELDKALQTASPAVFFTNLRACKALSVWFAEVEALFGVAQRADYHPEIDTGIHTLLALAEAAKQQLDARTRFAVLCHDLGKALTPTDILPSHHGHEQRGKKPILALCHRLKVPSKWQALAVATAEYHTHAHKAQELTAQSLLSLFKRFSALQDDCDFRAFLAACRCDARGRTGFEQVDYPQADYLLQLLAQLKTLDNRALIAEKINASQTNVSQTSGNKMNIDAVNDAASDNEIGEKMSGEQIAQIIHQAQIARLKQGMFQLTSGDL